MVTAQRRGRAQHPLGFFSLHHISTGQLIGAIVRSSLTTQVVNSWFLSLLALATKSTSVDMDSTGIEKQ